MQDGKKAATVAVGGPAKETSHKRQYSTSSALLQEACAYAAVGWPVLPIWGLRQGADGTLVCCCRRGAKCERPGKHPKVQRGIHSATTDLDTIRRWNWQDANLAVAAGQASAHIVLDVDLRNGGLDSLAALQEQFGRLPPAPKVITGDGWHLLFRYPAGMRLATRRLADGVDLLADGTCHIVPPSTHYSGRRYLWDPPLPDGQLPALPDLPDGWLSMLAEGQPQADLPPRSSTKEDQRCTKEYQRNTKETEARGCVCVGVNVTKMSRCERDKCVTQASQCSSSPPHYGTSSHQDLLGLLLEKHAALLTSTTPTGSGTRHRGLFKFLHSLKGIPDFANRPIVQLRPIVDAWYDAAVSESERRGFDIKATRDEHYLDAARIWRSLRYPKGRLMTDILERAKREQPAAAAQFQEPLRTFISALWHLQRHVGDKPFYLASSTAAKLLDYRTADGQPDKKRAWRVLKGLESIGILKCSDSGDNTRHRKAARYQFIGEA